MCPCADKINPYRLLVVKLEEKYQHEGLRRRREDILKWMLVIFDEVLRT
jgi:hypothetical protein